MLRSKVHQNRGYIFSIATSCAAVSCILGDKDQKVKTSSEIDQKSLHESLLPSSNFTFCHGAFVSPGNGFTLSRQPTVELLNKTANYEKTLESSYQIRWDNPIGIGTFGDVYQGLHRKTHTPVAIKKISKSFTNDSAFQREMEVLLHLERTGGHPSICLMHEHFNEGDHYYLVFDLVEGGELFDQLCRYGPYSEADAARTIRQTVSALAFLHGIGIVHSDLKPENLMLSSRYKEDCTIKIVDFGCAHLLTSVAAAGNHAHRGTGLTPAYCPPEVLVQVQENPKRNAEIKPPFDIWSLGVIMYM